MKGNVASYHSKIVGVTFEGRQDVISELSGDEKLRFRREPENQYDSNAVAVDVYIKPVYDNDGEANQHVEIPGHWEPIGYIAKDKNAELAQTLTDGRQATIKLKDITGGGDKAYGVNVYIEYEREIKKDRSANAELVKDVFGNEIFYDPILHEYTNALGEVYLSASAYASDDDFDAEFWSNYFVEAYGLDPSAKDEIKAMWNLNGDASRNFGTALHAAIELYGTYHHIADIIDIDLKTGERKKKGKVEKNSAMSKLPYLQQVVKKFFTPERLEEAAMYEVLVVDHKNKRAGRIDRLVLCPDGTYKVRDMKTNSQKLDSKSKKGYTKQLSFYGDLLIANGCTLAEDALVIHHWIENDWEDIPLNKIDTLEPEVTGSLSRQKK